MALGKGCNSCDSEHDGDFYNFCKCTCHDRTARRIVGEISQDFIVSKWQWDLWWMWFMISSNKVISSMDSFG